MFQYFVDTSGVLGLGASVIVLILFMVFQAIVAPIASEAVLASAGAIFSKAFGVYGIVAAIVGGYIGSILGALTAFMIARWVQHQLKERFVDKYVHEDQMNEVSNQNQVVSTKRSRFVERMARFLARFIDEDSEDFVKIIEDRGFEFVLIGRLLIFIPFDAVSYGSGLTRIRFKDFILATAIGSLPRVIMLVFLGERLKEVLVANAFMFIIVFIIAVIIILGAYYLSMKYLREKYNQNKTDAMITQ